MGEIISRMQQVELFMETIKKRSMSIHIQRGTNQNTIRLIKLQLIMEKGLN